MMYKQLHGALLKYLPLIPNQMIAAAECAAVLMRFVTKNPARGPEKYTLLPLTLCIVLFVSLNTSSITKLYPFNYSHADVIKQIT